MTKLTARSILLAVFFALTVAVVAVHADSFPKPTGRVSDFVGKLSAEQIQSLTQTVEEFDRQTSIEIAIAVITDHGGQSIESYANGLGNAWGVGKTGKNNGILLVWSPNDRKYWLTTGEGIKRYMHDGAFQDILDEHLKPRFKSGEYYQGLQKTIAVIIERLGNDSWEVREKKRVEHEAQENEAALRIVVIMAIVIFCILAIVIPAFIVHGRRETRKSMLENLNAIEQALGEAARQRPRVKQQIDALAEEMPEQDISALLKLYERQPDLLKSLQRQYQKFDRTRLNLGDADAVETLREKAESESRLTKDIKNKIRDIRDAKRGAEELLQQLSDDTFRLESLEITKGREHGTRTRMKEARQQYRQARGMFSLTGNNLVDYLIIHQLLINSRDNAASAASYATDTGHSHRSSYEPSDVASGSIATPSVFGGGGGFGGGAGGDY
jgi:uncharacterized protein